MKSAIYIFFFSVSTLFLFSSCNDTTYAKELKVEQALIDAFVKRHDIKVIKTLPADGVVWNENEYFLTDDGLYIHLTKLGDLNDGVTVEDNDIIVPRYIRYTLDVVADTVSNWTTIENPDVVEFKYKDFTQSCTAFHEAVKIMKRNNSEALLIVPSKISFDDFWSPATPMGFKLKIKIKR